MFARRQRNKVALPPHDAPDRTQRLAYAHDLALDQDALPDGDGLEIGHIQRPAHTQPEPETRLVDEREGQRGAVVEERGRAASMHVSQPVGVGAEDGVAEDNSGVLGVVGGPGMQLEMRKTRGHPLLFCGPTNVLMSVHEKLSRGTVEGWMK